jgi:hypothetical protein
MTRSVRHREVPKLSVLAFFAAYAFFSFFITEDITNAFKGVWTTSTGTLWSVFAIVFILLITSVVHARGGKLPDAGSQTLGAIFSMISAAPIAATAKAVPPPWDYAVNALPYAAALTLLYFAWKKEDSVTEELKILREEVASHGRAREERTAVIPLLVAEQTHPSSFEAASTRATRLLLLVASGLVVSGLLRSVLPSKTRRNGVEK